MQEHTTFVREIKVDDYLDNSSENLVVIAESSNPFYGTGAKVWDSCVCIAKSIGYLHEQGVYPLKDKLVVELGCGAGLISIYLAALGAKVIATDLPLIRELIEKNIYHNRIVTQNRAKFQVYNWNQEFKLALDQNPYCFVASEPFVAGPEAFQAFMKCVKALLTRYRQSRLILGFKARDNDLSKFEQKIDELELSCQRMSTDDMHPDYVDDRIVMYTLRA